MELHRQRCQACGSRSLNNLLVREPGEDTVVFVRCGSCSGLVARYVLRSYYHHGKGIESYLRSVHGSMESGRRTLDEFEAIQRGAVEGFERALEALADKAPDGE